MNAAWPGLENQFRNGWLLRSASSTSGTGVTQRANSIWPEKNPTDLASSLAAATEWYVTRRQPVIFQITHRGANSGLEDFLDERRFTKQSETLIMTARVEDLTRLVEEPEAKIKVELSAAPSEAWMNLFWSIDGRGGEAEKAVTSQIHSAARGFFAQAVDVAGTVIGVGRLALVDGWGGIYSMAVHPDCRRRGIANAVLSALLKAAAKNEVREFWLLVTDANTGAQELYQQAGFAEVARYHYRQAPPDEIRWL